MNNQAVIVVSAKHITVYDIDMKFKVGINIYERQLLLEVLKHDFGCYGKGVSVGDIALYDNKIQYKDKVVEFDTRCVIDFNNQMYIGSLLYIYYHSNDVFVIEDYGSNKAVPVYVDGLRNALIKHGEFVNLSNRINHRIENTDIEYDIKPNEKVQGLYDIDLGGMIITVSLRDLDRIFKFVTRRMVRDTSKSQVNIFTDNTNKIILTPSGSLTLTNDEFGELKNNLYTYWMEIDTHEAYTFTISGKTYKVWWEYKNLCVETTQLKSKFIMVFRSISSIDMESSILMNSDDSICLYYPNDVNGVVLLKYDEQKNIVIESKVLDDILFSGFIDYLEGFKDTSYTVDVEIGTNGKNTMYIEDIYGDDHIVSYTMGEYNGELNMYMTILLESDDNNIVKIPPIPLSEVKEYFNKRGYIIKTTV